MPRSHDETPILGIDFDGTVVVHEYPEIGDEVPEAVNTLRRLSNAGARLVLFTMRSGPTLAEAVRWFADRAIPLWGVNSNPDQHSWSQSPKAYCHAYIDDAAIGCPLIHPEGSRPVVDWAAVAVLVARKFFDPADNCPTHFVVGDPLCPACLSKQRFH